MASVLIMVDVQADMMLPPAPVPDAATVGPVIEAILGQARAAGAQVVHLRNSGPGGEPDEPGLPGWELVYDVADGESIVDKVGGDAFAGSDIADHLPAGADLVLVGMQSEYCVRDTAFGALRGHHPVTLVRGAHSTYPEEAPVDDIRARVEAELAAEGVRVVDPADLRF
jgi:nicotinamidase-related amidase